MPMADRRRVLLLGAGGFLGRHVRHAFELTGDHVLCVVGTRPSAAAWRSLDLATADVDELLVQAAADVVVNCAGRTHGTPDELGSANVAIVARLLDALERRPARLVQVGSAAEYGRGAQDRPTREDDPAEPVSVYGATKLEATGLVLRSRASGTVLRVFNPVGAGMAAESMPGRAASAMLEAMATGRDAITLGDLSAHRDFVDVRDVADAIALASHAGEISRLINVGSGTATTARSLVAELARVAGFRGELREAGEPSPRSDSVAYQCADIGLARRELGWQPSRSVRDAVSALWSGVRNLS